MRDNCGNAKLDAGVFVCEGSLYFYVGTYWTEYALHNLAGIGSSWKRAQKANG